MALAVLNLEVFCSQIAGYILTTAINIESK